MVTFNVLEIAQVYRTESLASVCKCDTMFPIEVKSRTGKKCAVVAIHRWAADQAFLCYCTLARSLASQNIQYLNQTPGLGADHRATSFSTSSPYADSRFAGFPISHFCPWRACSQCCSRRIIKSAMLDSRTTSSNAPASTYNVGMKPSTHDNMYFRPAFQGRCCVYCSGVINLEQIIAGKVIRIS